MSATPLLELPNRSADTTARLHPLLAGRWSPRGFDASYELTDAELTALLEAARWAPSAANAQPWRFLVGRRGEATFDAILALLMPGNQAWAPRASLLIVAVADTTEAPTAPWAGYDTGQAVAHLSVQAQALGLAAHQMGGFDKEKLIAAFGIPNGFMPMAMIAIGYQASADLLSPDYQTRELAARTRKPLGEKFFEGDWGAPVTPPALHD